MERKGKAQSVDIRHDVGRVVAQDEVRLFGAYGAQLASLAPVDLRAQQDTKETNKAKGCQPCYIFAADT